ncbi:MAG: carboxypeptidase-like regulatory domain-containing protein [Gammaproteobacteria bacterium]|nr:carboxypeptidase-like regulatory domain-containing protein [Gammaproteobacteria bacterium]
MLFARSVNVFLTCVALICISNIGTTAPIPDASAVNKPSSNKTAIDTVLNAKEGVEIILQLRVDRLILGDSFGIRKNNSSYIGMQNLFDILDFPININPDEKKGEGWFIKEGYEFSIKGSTKRAIISSRKKLYDIDPKNILYRPDDIYIETNTIFEILNIGYEINLSRLTLVLFPSEPLPIQEKLNRQKRGKPTNRNSRAILPQKDIPYRILSMPLVDFQTRYYTSSTGLNTSTYSAIGSGDLAYMTGTYYAQGSNEDYLRHFRLTLSRNSISPSLLGPLHATHFSFGEINPGSSGGVGVTGQEVGARISNKPFGRNLRFEQTDFTGDTQPGWDVELYHNNLFIGGQTVGDNGRYEFYNQNISYGKNEFKLVFYGPQGQRHEKIEIINLNSEGVSIGKILYDISLSNQQSQLFELQDNVSQTKEYNRRLNLSLLVDINKYVSFKSVFSRYTFSDGSRHNFIKPSIRLFILDTLLSASITKDITSGYSEYYSISKSFWKQAFSYSRTKTSRGFSTESTQTTPPNQATQNLSLSGRLLSSRFLHLNYGLNGSQNIVENTSISNTYGFNFSAHIIRLELNNNFQYSETTANGSNRTKILSGATNLGTSINRFTIRGGATYLLLPRKNVVEIRPKQITKRLGSISWRVTNKLRTQYNYSYSPINSNLSQSIALNWQNKKFSLTSNYTLNDNGTYTLYAGINFSLGYNTKTSSLKFGPSQISRSGAVAAHIYVDNNNNGTHDNNEPLIKGAKIDITQAYRNGKTDEGGNVFISGLATDRVTDIKLDSASLEDPFLVPSTIGYSFLPRPGLIENIDIPLVTSGEIEGTIHMENSNGGLRTAGYVPLKLTNTQTRKTLSVISAYDGFYLFSNIPPGKYLITIDNSYLNQYKYGTRKPTLKLVTINPSGTISMGNDFSIYPLK